MNVAESFLEQSTPAVHLWPAVSAASQCQENVPKPLSCYPVWRLIAVLLTCSARIPIVTRRGGSLFAQASPGGGIGAVIVHDASLNTKCGAMCERMSVFHRFSTAKNRVGVPLLHSRPPLTGPNTAQLAQLAGTPCAQEQKRCRDHRRCRSFSSEQGWRNVQDSTEPRQVRNSSSSTLPREKNDDQPAPHTRTATGRTAVARERRRGCAAWAAATGLPEVRP